MKVKDIIMRLRFDVNDIDSDRFPDDELIVDYINEALCEIYSMRPDLYQKTVVHKLDEGDIQKPCCCGKIYKVDAITDSNGVKIASIRKVDNSADIAFGKNNCKLSPFPTEYSIEEFSDRTFNVTPSVRPKQNIYVRVLCAVPPENLPFNRDTNVPDVSCDNYVAILDYVKYLMYATEQESVSSTGKAAFHLKKFYDSLGIKLKVKNSYVNGGEKGVE